MCRACTLRLSLSSHPLHWNKLIIASWSRLLFNQNTISSHDPRAPVENTRSTTQRHACPHSVRDDDTHWSTSCISTPRVHSQTQLSDIILYSLHLKNITVVVGLNTKTKYIWNYLNAPIKLRLTKCAAEKAEFWDTVTLLFLFDKHCPIIK